MKFNTLSTATASIILASFIRNANGIENVKSESSANTCRDHAMEEVNCSEKDDYLLWWKDLNDKCKKAYSAKGWTEESWNFDSSSEHDQLDWNDIPQNRREFLMSIGWTEEKWDNDFGNPGLFEPKITNVDIPELKKFDFEYFANLDLSVHVTDGTIVGDDEYSSPKYMQLSEYMKLFHQGTNLYLKYEDGEPFQQKLHKIIGKEVFSAFEQKLTKKGLIDGDWENYEYNEENWSFWLGPTGTSTSLHIDYDVFNFLWVMEGKKRVVVIPNTEETRAKYNCATHIKEHSCWPDIDVLHNGTLPENAVEFIVGPGQGIAVPRLAWHAVENLEPTIAFGFRIKDYVL